MENLSRFITLSSKSCKYSFFLYFVHILEYISPRSYRATDFVAFFISFDFKVDGLLCRSSGSHLNPIYLFQIQTRRMSRFNEGEKAREERKKYQKTAQVLTLFIASYIGQWWTWIVFCLWSFFDYPSDLFVSTLFVGFP